MRNVDKAIRKIVGWPCLFLSALVSLALWTFWRVGPRPSKSCLIPSSGRYSHKEIWSPEKLKKWEKGLLKREFCTPGLKPDNHARVLWYESNPSATDKVFLYLHGFGASPCEAIDLCQKLSKRYGANVYLPRLYGHGIDGKDALKYLTAENYWESAAKAVDDVLHLGKELIIVATSTGATKAISLAPSIPNLAAMVFFSPNIALKDNRAFLLTSRWGLYFARFLLMGVGRKADITARAKQYWTNFYRLEALVALQSLLERAISPDIFQNINIPVFCACYYKNPQEKDELVSISAILQMMSTIKGTSRMCNYPQAGNHCLISRLMAENTEQPIKDTFKFLEEEVNLLIAHPEITASDA